MKAFLNIGLFLTIILTQCAWTNDTGWLQETMVLPGSVTLPTACADKQVYVDTNATSGERFYLCESGTWVAQGGGMTSGATVTGGIDNTVLYIDDDGNLGSEAAFGYVDSTNTLTIGTLSTSSTSQGEVKFYEASANGSSYFSFIAPASLAGNITWILPSTDSAAVLQSNGSGTLTLSNVVVLAANSTVPSGANPTIDAAGEIGIDTSATVGSAIRFYGDAAYTLPGYQRISIVLDAAAAASDYEIGSFPANITIRAIRVLAVGGTNVVGGLQECDANGANCSAVDSDITATAATTATDDAALSNATIDANDQLQWLTTSVSGTNTRTVITVYYTYDSVN